MGIVASNPCMFMFTIGTFIGVRGTNYLLARNAVKAVRSAPSANNSKTQEKTDPYGDYRMIIGVRTDLKMQKGKVAAQCGHAAVAGYAKGLKEKPKTVKRWMKYGCAKITVKVDNEEELIKLDKIAKENDVLSSIVRDAGQTQVAPGTRTVIAIGPGPRCEIDKITGHLKLY